MEAEPWHPVRIFHFYYEVCLFGSSLALNSTVLYMVMMKTPPHFKGYARMIAFNSIIDIMFSVTDLVTMEVVDLHGAVLYLISDNPNYPKDPNLAVATAAFWIFNLYLTIIVIPLQFMYRYGLVCRDQPFKPYQIVAAYAMGCVYLAIHCFIFPFTFDKRSPKYDQILAENEIYRTHTPGSYIAGDATKITMALHFFNCDLMILISYAFTISFGVAIWKKLNKTIGNLNKEAANAQRYITMIMIMQATYPLIALVIPTGMIAVYPLISKPGESSQFGLVGVCMMNLIPVLNPLAVIINVPMYKNALISMVCGKHSKLLRDSKIGRTSQIISTVA
ncbi:unnamed protein product [Bursaphelenchus okinawaensis]|uniref:G protein-coupled receptor n=1 Tax=Bursaphelenchus okinawaensis TaxID=465554 RepID=A0A811LM39_9BILA|nr:unnamed protein product [Bursaphelenchus okinawaensis]CAG9124975.1 unnamed protein product [Bursaphelenchus okinawaensis]